jgi:hypothetical protein
MNDNEKVPSVAVLAKEYAATLKTKKRAVTLVDKLAAVVVLRSSAEVVARNAFSFHLGGGDQVQGALRLIRRMDNWTARSIGLLRKAEVRK